MRTHSRTSRRLGQEVAELTRAVTDPRAARDLARLVLNDLSDIAYPHHQRVAAAVAQRCQDDAQRSALAAYLHLCRDLSFDAVGDVFGVDAGAARRLVERGTGTAPVTAAEDCRGWALVAPRAGRTTAERHAASGHLSLCRRCRNKLRAHTVLEHRVAVAGTTTLGASLAAAVGRTFAGHVATSAAGAVTGPLVALSTAAAVTAGIGGFAVATHTDSPRTPANVQQHGDPAHRHET